MPAHRAALMAFCWRVSPAGSPSMLVNGAANTHQFHIFAAGRMLVTM